MQRDVPANTAASFFNQVCLFLRADNIQSAGVTIHEDIYIYIFCFRH